MVLRRRRHKDPVTELGASGMSDVGGGRRRDIGVGGGGGVDKGYVDMEAQLRWDSRNSCNLQYSDSYKDDGGCALVCQGGGWSVGGREFRNWRCGDNAGDE